MTALDSSLPELTLDPTVLEAFRQAFGDSSGRVIAELIDCYLAEAPVLFQSMQTAIEQQRLAELRRAAHSLKASSAALGAMALSHLCQLLESLASTDHLKQVGFSQADQMLAAILAEYARVQLALQQEKVQSLGQEME